MGNVASDAAEKTAPKQRGRPFRQGTSGNPRGRPKGARNRATVTAEALLDGEAEAISRKLIEKALEGDTTALRLCLERILPPRRDRPIQFEPRVLWRTSFVKHRPPSLIYSRLLQQDLRPLRPLFIRHFFDGLRNPDLIGLVLRGDEIVARAIFRRAIVGDCHDRDVVEQRQRRFSSVLMILWMSSTLASAWQRFSQGAYSCSTRSIGPASSPPISVGSRLSSSSV